ncbi:hypothetical protein Sru01_56370 [Sphaerisporangium rufum]|uniref:Uncharacterized protein n=1 Tax=Sphaerisporangium rufum TaxID=1381558 RepID=A0A919V7R6_9ACTN|nr:hypothetical protein [Sphaerisporangium rufum]GII80655.1 hypothetical protein Sru01_56370 [Sphaerisporangium rufum]
MNMLRDDLRHIAGEAPDVDLTERAIRGARRRRATAVAAAAAMALVVTAGTVSAVISGVLPARRAAPIVAPTPVMVASPLPDSGVGPLAHAHRTSCRIGVEENCVVTWRVETADGDVYRLDPARYHSGGPMAITPDGLRLAYYDPARQRFQVRDLASGQVWTAPRQTGPELLDNGDTVLRISPDGLHLTYSCFGCRSKPYNVLIDMAGRRQSTLPAEWIPVSVGAGGGPVTLIWPYDDHTSIRVLDRAGRDERRTVTIQTFTDRFSTLGPDGRTIAWLDLGTAEPAPQARIVVTDLAQGGSGRSVTVGALPDGYRPARLGSWLGPAEVTMLAYPEEPGRGATPMLYAVDVATGAVREIMRLPADQSAIVVPGLVR